MTIKTQLYITSASISGSNARQTQGGGPGPGSFLYNSTAAAIESPLLSWCAIRWCNQSGPIPNAEELHK